MIQATHTHTCNQSSCDRKQNRELLTYRCTEVAKLVSKQCSQTGGPESPRRRRRRPGVTFVVQLTKERLSHASGRGGDRRAEEETRRTSEIKKIKKGRRGVTSNKSARQVEEKRDTY